MTQAGGLEKTPQVRNPPVSDGTERILPTDVNARTGRILFSALKKFLLYFANVVL